jgi:hypothetical protein
MAVWIPQFHFKIKGGEVSYLLPSSSIECCICQDVGDFNREPLQSFCPSLYHLAHASCMTQWYLTTQAKTTPTCPVCRQPLRATLCYDTSWRKLLDWKRMFMRSTITLVFLLCGWRLLGRHSMFSLLIRRPPHE